MKPWPKFVSRLPVLLCALALAGVAQAQFEPGKVKPEPPGVAAHFAEPAVRYATPGLREAREDFTSHAEMLAFVESLAKAAPRLLHVEVLGQSQEGRAMPLLVLSAKSGVNPKLPTVLVLGQQHGNEPAGGEAALVLAQQLSGPRASLLEQVNVLIVPRANPDGAERFTRVSANGIDINRDHLLLRTPEARLIAGVAARYRPQVVLDLHEFTVGDRWIAKFGAYERYDALLQAATVGNLNPRLGEFSEHAFLDTMRAALAADGQHAFWYHTSSTSGSDKRVSMG
ncbi:MAG TPA: M14 family zinc carboxypeptidase, partial [Methylibium sp.]